MKITAKDLSLDEKITLLTGKNLWQTEDFNGKIPSIFMADGPSGLRKLERIPSKKDDLNCEYTTVKSTAMPCLSAVANTWNTELAYLDGKTIADECVEHDVDILLAPGVNIKRTPVCGRNFEYFSEDPVLAGELAKAYISGAQDKGVGTCIKHFALNNREDERTYQSIDVDERAINEIYTLAFKKAFEAKPYSLMCSYNPVNGIYASENPYLLDYHLRGQLKYDGVVISDWGAVYNPYKAHNATLDIEMPYNGKSFKTIKDAYEKGLISLETIDSCVDRILNLVYKCKAADKKVEFSKDERHENAVKIALESVVLLKNDGILPLKDKNVAVSATPAVIGGWGSSRVVTDYEVPSLISQLEKEQPDTCFTEFYHGEQYYPKAMRYNALKEGYIAAYQNDAVILGVTDGNDAEGEGYDRRSIKLHERIEEKIIKTAKINPNVIVVVYAGSAIDMSAWIDKVRAVIYAGHSGEGVNEALAKLITGKENFSGKLSETFPLSLQDIPSYGDNGNGFSEWYKEGLFVGYRHYDKYNLPVLFPFGHGLSYAKFEYGNLKIDKISETDYELSYTITNVSDVDGKEVSEVYIKDVFSSVIRPEKELKRFSKNLIRAGETITVKVNLSKDAFAFYSPNVKDWYVENGAFEVLVGASATDIRLKGKIDINLPDDEQFTVVNKLNRFV